LASAIVVTRWKNLHIYFFALFQAVTLAKVLVLLVKSARPALGNAGLSVVLLACPTAISWTPLTTICRCLTDRFDTFFLWTIEELFFSHCVPVTGWNDCPTSVPTSHVYTSTSSASERSRPTPLHVRFQRRRQTSLGGPGNKKKGHGM
jgi:hypothetical protein